MRDRFLMAAVAAGILCGAAARPSHAAEVTGRPWQVHVIDDSSKGADGVKLGDINKDGLMDVATGWEEGGISRVYINPGPKRVKAKWPAVTIGKVKTVEDAVFVDLNRDGVLDVVNCCEGGTKTMYVHWAPRDPRRIMDPSAWKQEAIPASKGVTPWMLCLPMDVDKANGIDLVAGGKWGSKVGWFQGPRNPSALADYKFHQITKVDWVMSIKKSDMDGDGDEDVVISDRGGKMRGVRWLENPGPGPAQFKEWTNHFIGARKQRCMTMALGDLDGDGLQDVVVPGASDVIVCRRLDRRGKFAKERGIRWPKGRLGRGKAVAIGDINRDGRQDIILDTSKADGNKSGVIWMSYSGRFSDWKWSFHEISGPAGVKYDRIELIDLDKDGDLDLMTCEEHQGGVGTGLGVIWYENPTIGPGSQAPASRKIAAAVPVAAPPAPKESAPAKTASDITTSKGAEGTPMVDGKWKLVLEEDFSKPDALSNWKLEGCAETSVAGGELSIRVTGEPIGGRKCSHATLWHKKPTWGDVRYVIKARGEKEGMRLLFFNARALTADKSIFAWERKVPTWSSYVGEERMALYTTGMIRFRGKVNMRCIGGPMAKLYNQRNRAPRGSAEQKKMSREYSSRELLASPNTLYDDPGKSYVIDVQVVGNRIKILVDGKLSVDVVDKERASAPMAGGYFGLRNFVKGTRTWYDYVKVYKLAK